MEELTMFERLLTLPIFQGMTLQELSEVFAYVRLDFVKHNWDDTVVSQGMPCKNLIFVINGELSSTMKDEQGRFTITEKLPRVTMIEPYNMFGLKQKYSRDYSFATDGVTLAIDRQVFLNNLMSNKIVKINVLNIICSQYHKTHKILEYSYSNTVAGKIVKFLHTYSSVAKGEKEVTIKMTTLADIIQETRLNVSKALNEFQSKGLIVLGRGGFVVHALEDLK